ncbi:unnamed protein product [Moneuplotes crassus]|uniref:Uncharacterized protein n=1 Tax=Euplotes crassus TaxID=5936 RepID=A0AAD1XN96_EUPCR|nr:unnamed protein product [Moneuplotes crassus]
MNIQNHDQTSDQAELLKASQKARMAMVRNMKAFDSNVAACAVISKFGLQEKLPFKQNKKADKKVKSKPSPDTLKKRQEKLQKKWRMEAKGFSWTVKS